MAISSAPRIAKGRIVEIDTREAERAPGVLLVMTHRNAPAQPEFGPAGDADRAGGVHAGPAGARERSRPLS